MLINTQGIVLKQRKIANNRRMITVFTKNYGKISAGTSMSEKGRTKSALALRPFTYADYDVFKGRESYSVNSAQVIKSYYSIGEDLDRFLIASKLIEYLDKILEDEQPRPKLFDMTVEFFESLTRCSGNYDTLLYAFIAKTLRVQGVMPELKSCVNCGKDKSECAYELPDNQKGYMFSVTSGGLVCEECANREKTTSNSLIHRPKFDIINVFIFFLNNPLSRFEKVKLKEDVSKEIEMIIGEYINHYLGVNLFSEDIKWR